MDESSNQQTAVTGQPTTDLEREVASRTRELAVLNTIAAVVSQSLDAQQMLEAALEEVRDLLRMEHGCIYALEGQEQLLMIAQRGLTASLVSQQHTLEVEGTLSGMVARAGQALALANGESELASHPSLQSQDIRTYVGVPLRSMRQVVGVLVLLSRSSVPITERDLRLLEAIGDHVGVALANARLFEAEQERRRQAEILQTVATVVGSSHSLPEVLQRILEQLNYVVHYDSAAVQLLKGEEVEVIACRGFPDPGAIIGLHFPLSDDYPNTYVIRKGEPLFVNNITEKFEVFRRPPFDHIRSWMGVPLTSQGKTIGMLTLDRHEESGFRRDDASMAASFASQAALALERTQLLDAERRRRQIAEALREGLVALTSTLDLTAVLEAIVAQACRLMGSQHCGIYELGEDNLLRVRSSRGLPIGYVRGAKLPLGQPPVGLAVKERRPVAILDTGGLEGLDERAYDPQTLRHVQDLTARFRSLIAVPIVAGDEIYGGIAVYYREAGNLRPEQEAILTIFAGQAALAIKNARLLERERTQRAQLQALNDRIAGLNAIGRAAASSLETSQTLPDLSAAVRRLLRHDRLVLALLDDRHQQLTLLSYPSSPVQGCSLEALPEDSPVCRALSEGRPVTVQSISQQSAFNDPTQEGLASLLAVPLVLHDRTVGALCLGSVTERAFNDTQADLASAIAEEIATAIVNAQLHLRSRELVLVEERNRLARELHDSVTQLLFSISLMAQTAHTRLDSRPDQAERVLASLSTIQDLAQNAQNEMRSLIFELRPAALQEAGLVTALQRHLGGFRNRSGIDVSLHIDKDLEEERFPLPVEETVYRIAQEALHNSYKHAQPQHIRLTLSRAGRDLLLTVEDDGTGFDPAAPLVGQHLGRTSMSERAAAIGGTLAIESAPGKGTVVRARLPLKG